MPCFIVENTFTNRLICYAFGCPCIGPENTYLTTNQDISVLYFMTAEKFYPPGRILTMDRLGLTLNEVPRRNFREILLHARMLDLSRHIPRRYERSLNKLWHKVDHSKDSS